ncbi:MAG: hypothetical protein HY329_19645 [Chloroflexi bacterium]|nr:hypothetical protein [Chloroflexota bacterium]
MKDTSLYLVGDVYITRNPPDSMLAHVAPVLRGADVVFANCEAPISDRGTPMLGKPIFYSVGNFAFEQLHHYYGRETMLINCTVRDRKIVRVAVKPGWINDRCEPTILDLQAGHAAVELLVDTSRELGTELRPAGDELLVVE